MRPEPSRRDRWKTRVLKTPSLTAGTRLFLVHVLSKYMKADGFVSRPRRKLAAEVGLSERQVARYIAHAVDNGWLVLVAGGYKTMTAEYQATFPNPQRVTQHVTQTGVAKGDMNDHPIGVTKASPFERSKGDTKRHTTSSTTTRHAGKALDRTRNLACRPHLSLLRLGFGIRNRNATDKPHCQTQARTVERHRWRPTAAQVERHPSGTGPAMRFSSCPTRPRRKAQR